MLTKFSKRSVQSVLSMNEMSTFERELERHGKIIYPNVGDSMMPLIKQGRDVLVIERATLPLKKGDIPLYKRDNGQYVLHRIISARGGKYKICGDNRAWVEKGIEDRHIIGVLVGIIRYGKEIPLAEAEGKFYRFKMCNLFFLKRLKYGFRALRRKIKSKLRKKRI